MNYGFIPLTLSGDNDPLDVFVLCSQPIEKLSIVRCYPIGMVAMADHNGSDEKIIAIPFGDPQYNGYTDIKQLPQHILDELVHFLQVYKQLENKKVKILEVGNHTKAKECIKQSIKFYKQELQKGNI